jgi:hypothetical protein
LTPPYPSTVEIKGSRDKIKGSRDRIKGSRDKIKGSRDKIKGSRDEIDSSRDEIDSSTDFFLHFSFVCFNLASMLQLRLQGLESRLKGLESRLKGLEWRSKDLESLLRPKSTWETAWEHRVLLAFLFYVSRSWIFFECVPGGCMVQNKCVDYCCVHDNIIRNLPL